MFGTTLVARVPGFWQLSLVPRPLDLSSYIFNTRAFEYRVGTYATVTEPQLPMRQTLGVGCTVIRPRPQWGQHPDCSWVSPAGGGQAYQETTIASDPERAPDPLKPPKKVICCEITTIDRHSRNIDATRPKPCSTLLCAVPRGGGLAGGHSHPHRPPPNSPTHQIQKSGKMDKNGGKWETMGQNGRNGESSTDQNGKWGEIGEIWEKNGRKIGTECPFFTVPFPPCSRRSKTFPTAPFVVESLHSLMGTWGIVPLSTNPPLRRLVRMVGGQSCRHWDEAARLHEVCAEGGRAGEPDVGTALLCPVWACPPMHGPAMPGVQCPALLCPAVHRRALSHLKRISYTTHHQPCLRSHSLQLALQRCTRQRHHEALGS